MEVLRLTGLLEWTFEFFLNHFLKVPLKLLYEEKVNPSRKTSFR